MEQVVAAAVVVGGGEALVAELVGVVGHGDAGWAGRGGAARQNPRAVPPPVAALRRSRRDWEAPGKKTRGDSGSRGGGDDGALSFPSHSLTL